jgi:hypothetical protein
LANQLGYDGDIVYVGKIIIRGLMMPHPNGIVTYEEIRKMSEGDLIQEIEKHIRTLNLESAKNTININYLLLVQPFRDELVRREQDKITQAMLGYTEKMHSMTKQMRCMTVIILVATVFGVAAAILSVLRQFSVI